MVFGLALAETGYPADGDVLAQARACAAAAQDKAQLLVFPECYMQPRHLSAAELCSLAEPLDGPFTAGMAQTARRHGLWMVYTMCERREDSMAPYNTAVVMDDTGAVRATYRKCHLYDAHHVRESDRTSMGDTLCPPVETPFATLGVGICYDLRFPELARHLAVGGCNLLLYPAAWYDGPHKRAHWQTLLAARAIENECYVAGVCHTGRHLIASSMVADPLGEPVELEEVDCQRQDARLLVAAIDLKRMERVRTAMPLLEHRRPQLYHTLVERP